MISGVRFDEPLESEFQLSFGDMGRKSRHEMWAVLLIVITAGIVFHHTLLRVPPEVLPLGRTLLVAVAIPMVLRWLSGDRSPLRRWSSALYIASVYIDVACLMLLRIACIRHGLDVVPLAMPMTILMSLIVVRIRFVLLAPAILAGMTGIVATELWAFEPTSNQLFDITALIAMVTVALAAAYELERSTRMGWLRARTLAALTRTDSLTGVPNRRYFDEQLAELAQTARRSGQSLVVMVLDIDDFKAFNDRNGHLAGDECLRRVGSYLGRSMSGANEFCARLGGEEFVAVWCADPAAMATRGDEIRSGIAKLAIAHDADGRVVTASAGLAHDPAPDPATITAVELLRYADSALYRAKRDGRDQLVVSDQQMAVIGSRGRALDNRRSATPADVLQPAQLTPHHEAEFRQVFDRQGRISRAAIMLGLDAVCIAMLSSYKSVLKMPPESQALGVHTLVYGIMPIATLAAVTALVPRLYRFSAPMFIIAVAVITSAQMYERAVQLPQGYDVVPYLMPTAVLLSMCVVKIRFGLLGPSVLAILLWVSAIELWVFPWTSNRLLTVGTSIFMVAVTARFSYTLERSVRLAWLDERKLDELTRIDPLTGLANRRSFDEALDALDVAAETRYAAVMILDVDDFKGFNDRYGHPAGDDALRAVGAYLIQATDGQDVLVARIGGEEFAALWQSPDTGDGTRKRQAEALRDGVGALGPMAGTATTLTASAGFAETRSEPTTAASFARELVERADQALYDAKGRGRNQLVEIATDTADHPRAPVRYE
ncbi:MAG: diguanylate cyclase [Mycobacterium sp.]